MAIVWYNNRYQGPLAVCPFLACMSNRKMASMNLAIPFKLESQGIEETSVLVLCSEAVYFFQERFFLKSRGMYDFFVADILAFCLS